MTKINRYLIFKNKTIKNAINLIDKKPKKLAVVEKKKLIGSVTWRYKTKYLKEKKKFK